MPSYGGILLHHFLSGPERPPLVGGTFTWSMNRESPSWSRIDRFLISPTWETQSLGVSQRRLPRLFSNHFPILLDYDDFLRGGKSFTFESIRLKSKGFVDEVKQWWESYHFQGSAM